MSSFVSKSGRPCLTSVKLPNLVLGYLFLKLHAAILIHFLFCLILAKHCRDIVTKVIWFLLVSPFQCCRPFSYYILIGNSSYLSLIQGLEKRFLNCNRSDLIQRAIPLPIWALYRQLHFIQFLLLYYFLVKSLVSHHTFCLSCITIVFNDFLAHQQMNITLNHLKID